MTKPVLPASFVKTATPPLNVKMSSCRETCCCLLLTRLEYEFAKCGMSYSIDVDERKAIISSKIFSEQIFLHPSPSRQIVEFILDAIVEFDGACRVNNLAILERIFAVHSSVARRRQTSEDAVQAFFRHVLRANIQRAIETDLSNLNNRLPILTAVLSMPSAGSP